MKNININSLTIGLNKRPIIIALGMSIIIPLFLVILNFLNILKIKSLKISTYRIANDKIYK